MSVLPFGRVVCSDALAFLRSLPDECVDCVCTDPPYPIGHGEKTFRQDGGDVTKRVLFVDHPQEKAWFVEGYDDWQVFWPLVVVEMVRVLKKGGHLYVFSNEANLWGIRPLTEAAAPVLQFKSLLVWHKGNKPGQPYGMGYHYRKSCEYVVLWSKGDSARHVTGYGTLMQFARNDYAHEHPTPKPVPLVRFLIQNSTEQGGGSSRSFQWEWCSSCCCFSVREKFPCLRHRSEVGGCCERSLVTDHSRGEVVLA